MKTGRSVIELADELTRQQDAKRDLLMNAGDLRVATVPTQGGATYLSPEGPFDIGDVAHGQIAEYAGIPRPFYERLRLGARDLRVPPGASDADGEGRYDRIGPDPWSSEADARLTDACAPYGEALFDTTVNCLLKAKGDDKRLVRTLDGRARALLSGSYNPDLDNYDVFAVAARVIDEAGLTPDHVISCEVTERRLYLKVVSPKLEAAVRPSNVRDGHGYLKEPQVVQAGFLISNSEVGLGSLCVQQVVYKLMCTNLWVMEEGYRRRHVGRALEADEDGVSVYRSDTRIADARARLLKLRDHVQAALDESRFRMLVARMQDSTEIPISGSIEKSIAAAGRKFGLSGDEKELVLRNLIQGADLSVWGLTNSITAAASQASGYDRATELEAIGGRLLAMPQGELREIIAAK